MPQPDDDIDRSVPLAPLVEKSGISPELQDFISKRAHEIAAAQKDAEERRHWTQLGNDFARGGDLIAGRQTDAGAEQAKLAEANRPVADVQQRHAAEDAAVKDFGARQDLDARSQARSFEQQKRDPASQVSKRIQALWSPILGDNAQFLSAADYEQAEKIGGLNIQKLAQVAAAKRADADNAHRRVEESQGAQRLKIEQQRVDQEGAKAAQGKGLSEGEVDQLTNLDAAEKAMVGYLDKLKGLRGKTMGSLTRQIGANMPLFNTDEKNIGADGAIAGKLVAKGIEGARLTDNDMKYYEEKVIPQATDPAELQLSKGEAVLNQLRTKRQSILGAAGSAGRNTSGFSPGPAAQQPAQPPTAPPPAVLAHYKAQLQPGERLAVNAAGQAKALGPTDPVPPGFTEVR